MQSSNPLKLGLAHIDTEEGKLILEEFDDLNDTKFIKDALQPYFKDMFKDLAMRTMGTKTGGSSEKKLDRVVFTEYC